MSFRKGNRQSNPAFMLKKALEIIESGTTITRKTVLVTGKAKIQIPG